MVDDEAPRATGMTPYDQEHFVTYARLLDAEADRADWRDAARVILRRNPDADPCRARRCWQSHLNRARWIATNGYQQLIARAASGNSVRQAHG
jgi:hypothetical protein